MSTHPDYAVPDRDALRFVKGHGTQNDFVVLTDPAATLDLDDALVAAICDRRRGIGADGLLRVARSAALVAAGVLSALPDGVAPDDWFMDYRNADGSIAEMCGNGVRVFAHFVRATGLEEADEFTVGSRAGGRPVIVHSADHTDADVSVEMGPVTVTGESVAHVGDVEFSGAVVDVGNPHLACVIDGLCADGLAAVDFTPGARFDTDIFGNGANLEIVTPAVEPTVSGGPLTAQMRVLERGVGETRSCGTGLVAAGAALLRARGERTGVLEISVPGGTVEVTITDDGARLRGPSRLVADGVFRPAWDGA